MPTSGGPGEPSESHGFLERKASRSHNSGLRLQGDTNSVLNTTEYVRARIRERILPTVYPSCIQKKFVVSVSYLHRIGELMIQRMCQDVSCRLYPHCILHVFEYNKIQRRYKPYTTRYNST
jgi:hypothetical protein